MKVSGILAPMVEPLIKGLDPKLLNDVENMDNVSLKDIDIASLIAPLAQLTESDFTYIQEKCLEVCTVNMPSGSIPVVYDNGSFSVPDLEEDGMTIMALMVHTLIHNFTGFFEGSPLRGLLGGILATNSPN